VEPQAEDEELPKVDGLRILKTNGPEWLYILLGALASVIMGASMPVYAILFGEVNSQRNAVNACGNRMCNLGLRLTIFTRLMPFGMIKQMRQERSSLYKISS